MSRPIDEDEQFDRQALELESRIILSSESGRRMVALLRRSMPNTAADGFAATAPFDHLSVRRRWPDIWILQGRIGNTVYGLAVTDIEIQYIKVV